MPRQLRPPKRRDCHKVHRCQGRAPVRIACAGLSGSVGASLTWDFAAEAIDNDSQVTVAAKAKGRSYVYEALGLNPAEPFADDYKLRNDFDAHLRPFLAGVLWALDELPSDADG